MFPQQILTHSIVTQPYRESFAYLFKAQQIQAWVNETDH